MTRYVTCIDASQNPIFGTEGQLHWGRTYRVRLQSPDGFHLYGIKANTVSRAFERERFIEYPNADSLTRFFVWLREVTAKRHPVTAS